MSALKHSPKKNRLLALEQALAPEAIPKSRRRRRKPPHPRRRSRARRAKKRPQVEAQAFDWDEPIELTYNGETDSYTPATHSAPAESAQSFAVGDEEEDFQVEAFDWDEDSGGGDSDPPGYAPNRELTDADLAEDLDFSNLDAALKQGEPSQALSESDFAADLQAIIRGDKVYDQARGGMADAAGAGDTLAAAQSNQSPASVDAEAANPHDVFAQMAAHMPHQKMTEPAPASSPTHPAETETAENTHDVFDRMGHNMSYANSFDLGTISIQQRFDEFDEMLNHENTQHSNAAVDAAEPQANSFALELDEGELAADLALMTDKPPHPVKPAVEDTVEVNAQHSAQLAEEDASAESEAAISTSQ